MEPVMLPISLIAQVILTADPPYSHDILVVNYFAMCAGHKDGLLFYHKLYPYRKPKKIQCDVPCIYI